jgi:hypothetical protein
VDHGVVELTWFFMFIFFKLFFLISTIDIRLLNLELYDYFCFFFAILNHKLVKLIGLTQLFFFNVFLLI